METLVVAALVAAVVSAGVGWVRDAVQEYLRRPQLVIDSCEFHDAGDTRHFYLTVRNKGRTTARACVAQLTIAPLMIDEIYDGALVTRESLLSGGTASLTNVATKWQRVDSTVELDIHPEQSQRLELAAGKVMSGGERDPHGNRPEAHSLFFMPTERGYAELRIRFRGKGFQFLLRVGADNAEAVHRWGQILANTPHPPTIELSESRPTNPFPEDPDPLRLLRGAGPLDE